MANPAAIAFRVALGTPLSDSVVVEASSSVLILVGAGLIVVGAAAVVSTLKLIHADRDGQRHVYVRHARQNQVGYSRGRLDDPTASLALLLVERAGMSSEMSAKEKVEGPCVVVIPPERETPRRFRA